jgi:hypothetical protein
MLDAIAEIDNLGMEDSTLAADASPTSLETNTAMGESQGSSMQSTDFNQSLMDMLSSLDAPADATNPSLQIVSGQSLNDALADAIPGLDPTTVTPPDPLAQDASPPSLNASTEVLNPSLKIVSGQSLNDALADAIPGLDPTTVTPPDPLAQDANLNPFMMAALTELDNPAALGKAFQTVSDGFEGLSDSFEQLAASFLSQDSNADAMAIDANAGDASTSPEVKNVAIGNMGDTADTSFDTNKMAIADVSSNAADTKVDKMAIADVGSDAADTNVDKMAIADVGSDTVDTNVDKMAIAKDTNTTNADFGIGDMVSNTKSSALGMDFKLDFGALKVNVDQVSRGLQFLVKQLEAAFEGDDSALTTSSTVHSLR